MRRSLPLLVLLAACSDAGGPSARLTPTAFQVVAGAAQVDTVARELKDMIALRVLAADAGPVPNYPINWTALDGGSVFAPVAYSGTDGVARQKWTLGTVAGQQRLVARALDPETGAVLVDDTVTAEAMPDVAWGFWQHPAGGVTVAVGDSAWLWLERHDAHGNAGAPCADRGPGDLIAWGSDSTLAFPDTTRINERGEVGTWLHGVTADLDRLVYVTAVDSREKAWGFYGTCIAAAAGSEAKEVTWSVLVTP